MNQEIKNIPDRPHHIIIDGRSTVSVSGVTEVERFDEEEVCVVTNRGGLILHGRDLHMEKLSLDTGEIAVSGELDALAYEDRTRETGFFSRLFRS